MAEMAKQEWVRVLGGAHVDRTIAERARELLVSVGVEGVHALPPLCEGDGWVVTVPQNSCGYARAVLAEKQVC